MSFFHFYSSDFLHHPTGRGRGMSCCVGLSYLLKLPMTLVLVRPYQEHCFRFCAAKNKKGTDKLEHIQQRDIKIALRLGLMTLEESLKGWGFHPRDENWKSYCSLQLPTRQ